MLFGFGFRFELITTPAAAFMQSPHHPTPSVVGLPFVLEQSLHSIAAISLTPNKTRVKCRIYELLVENIRQHYSERLLKAPRRGSQFVGLQFVCSAFLQIVDQLSQHVWDRLLGAVSKENGMSTVRTHESQSRDRRSYANQPHCPQDAQSQVAVPVTQWVRQMNHLPRAVAKSSASTHVVQTCTKPQWTPRNDLPPAREYRFARPPRASARAQRATTTHDHEGAVTIVCPFHRIIVFEISSRNFVSQL